MPDFISLTGIVLASWLVVVVLFLAVTMAMRIGR